MNELIVSLAAAMTILGGFVFAAGLQPPAAHPANAVADRLLRRWRSWPRTQRVRLAVGVAVALAVTLFTGFVPALVLIPVAIVLLPELLSGTPQSEVILLEALDRWVRALTASVGTGKSVVDAIRMTRSQTPPVLAESVHNLLARLDDRWTLREALQATADELDSADSDAVLAALILVGERGGVGASATLKTLAASLQDRLRALREINAERTKPLVVVRQVTGITVVVMGAAVLMSPEYFAPYRSPLGQLLLLMVAGCYLGALAALRRIATPRRRDRVLVAASVAAEVSHG